MNSFSPSLDSRDAERTLTTLIRTTPNPLLFLSGIKRLQHRFSVCSAYCRPPFAGHGVHITPEITYQCEHWLPLDELRPYFYQFYRHVLSYRPVLSSTPFARAASWAGIVSHFPQFLHTFENPAVLLEQLLSDAELRMKFLFCSFMPERFYGRGSDRYPGQAATIEEWARHKRFRGIRLRCLDAASGDGASTYGVTRLLAKQGWEADRLEIEGWTLEPLETWAAAYNRFPHDPAHEAVFRKNNVDCFEQKLTTAIRFCCTNILDVPKSERFDLILCNGLLGGPIINDVRDVETVVRNLSGLLTPGGLLLAADHFHGGWKQKCPQQKLRALCELNGLTVIETAEGIAALMR